jgi:hypothetical protein
MTVAGARKTPMCQRIGRLRLDLRAIALVARR